MKKFVGVRNYLSLPIIYVYYRTVKLMMVDVIIIIAYAVSPFIESQSRVGHRRKYL